MAEPVPFETWRSVRCRIRDFYGVAVFDAFDAEEGVVIDVDRRVVGALLPDGLGGRWVKLRIYAKDIVDFCPSGMECALVFSGEPFTVRIPWESVSRLKVESDEGDYYHVCRAQIRRMSAEMAQEILEYHDDASSTRDSLYVKGSLKRALRQPEKMGRLAELGIAGNEQRVLADERDERIEYWTPWWWAKVLRPDIGSLCSEAQYDAASALLVFAARLHEPKPLTQTEMVALELAHQSTGGARYHANRIEDADVRARAFQLISAAETVLPKGAHDNASHAPLRPDAGERDICALGARRAQERVRDEAFPVTFRPGDRVMLVSTKHAPSGRISWRVVSCDCSLCAAGRFVAVDEPGIDGGQRHVAARGLREGGNPSRHVGEAWLDLTTVKGGECGALTICPGVAHHAMASIALADTLGSVADDYIDTSMMHGPRPSSLGRRSLHAVIACTPPGKFRDLLEWAAKAGSDGSMWHRWACAVERQWGDGVEGYYRAISEHMKRIAPFVTPWSEVASHA